MKLSVSDTVIFRIGTLKPDKENVIKLVFPRVGANIYFLAPKRLLRDFVIWAVMFENIRSTFD